MKTHLHVKRGLRRLIRLHAMVIVTMIIGIQETVLSARGCERHG